MFLIEKDFIENMCDCFSGQQYLKNKVACVYKWR